ncbi:endo alpha-1,4 polygalactosaminidase [Kiloniella laminariae]|uniref:Endo alpha-1,4 polygalactosaminidase n=1 Tax=Kiloniella laminariae TaxID=454162 RepID=A0ABT4LHY7_9PROT|nr:endo alpha-1,4 polygalactosaminidase [Kiloniella laminariae]MCZ4280714.1 endo alpha-1,4 polygalactosaminidase [Kiloniella laminariae]
MSFNLPYKQFCLLLSLFLFIFEVTSAAAEDWWRPHGILDWDWQLQPPHNFDRKLQMIDLDLFDTPKETIDSLQQSGTKVVCYINVGAWEDWRNDALTFPPEILGKDYQGWEGERWLDIRRRDLLAPIMLARLDLCAAKGFDGVEPDNMDLHNAETGFEISRQDQLAYSIWLAEEAHRRGLSIGQKNAPDLARNLVSHFDWALTEDCFVEGWCQEMSPYPKTGKTFFAAEYTDRLQTISRYCQEATQTGISLILKDRELTRITGAGCP